VIYEQREPWWNDIESENSRFFDQSSLAVVTGNSSSSYVGGPGEGNDEFGFTKYLIHTSKGYLACRKILVHWADGFISLPKEGVLRICIALERPVPSAGFEPANLGPNIKNANH
jgi:hypothetical protein